MNEKEPVYVKKIIDHIDRKIDETNSSIKELETMMIDGFSQVHKRLDNHDEKFKQIDARFEQIDNRFSQNDDRFDRLDSAIYDIKEDIRKIEGHIGRYEIRAQNIEQILLQDHKPRIAELERIAFA